MPLPVLSDRMSLNFNQSTEIRVTVIGTSGGGERRNRHWPIPKRRYRFGYPAHEAAVVGVDFSTVSEIRSFFTLVGGRHMPFHMKDWARYELIDEVIGTGDGTDTTFQAKFNISNGLTSETRDITYLVAGYVVEVNGTPVTVSTEVDGLLTLASPPALGASVTLTGEYKVKVRFDQDDFTIELLSKELAHIPELTAIEVL